MTVSQAPPSGGRAGAPSSSEAHVEAPFLAPAPYVPLPAAIAVLLSGRGSNFVALADACERGDVPARIAVVVSDRPEARGLAIARERGLPVRAVPRTKGEPREAHDTRVVEAIEEAGARFVCLAGYMRILSGWFVERFALRVLNVHPALLPAFPGTDAQAQALRYGVRVAGATVHFVDAGVDSGPIAGQEAVPVLDRDTPELLSERILAVEHRLYPATLARILRGGWRLDGRRLVYPG